MSQNKEAGGQPEPGLHMVKEVFTTHDMHDVLDRLKKGWLLHKVASHQDDFLFLLVRI